MLFLTHTGSSSFGEEGVAGDVVAVEAPTALLTVGERCDWGRRSADARDMLLFVFEWKSVNR